MNEIEKLDTVLRYMASMYPQSFAERHPIIANQILEVHPELRTESNDFTAELFFILQKLSEDGYVRQEVGDPHGRTHYAITFNGAYFIKYDGGYQGLQNRRDFQAYLETQRERKVDALASFQRKQAARLNLLTAWAVGGTIALLLWELVKYFVFDHHWYFHPY